MPVNTESKGYKARKNQWKKCRDCIAGSDVVKNEASIYLPYLDDQTEKEYAAYNKRALFYGASQRTVQALMGAIFRKNYMLEYPDFLEEQLESITLDGKDFATFARDVVLEILTVGRAGILADVIGQDATRPYLAVYTGENIINWREVLLGSSKVVTMIVLRESYEEKRESDNFDCEEKDQYRVLMLGKENQKSSIRYVQEVYRKSDSEWAMVPDLHAAPVRMGQPLTEIPLTFINTYDLTPSTDKPPLLDLVEVNLSHYRTCADLEHGAHYTALPTPWVAGFPADSELKIGSSVAWITEETDAKAGFLEYTGQGLGTLQEIKRDKEQLMAVLGAKLLEESKRVGEAADTLRIRAASESGSLTAITKNISAGIEESLRKLAWWSGATDQQIADINFELNTDFVDARLQPQELSELMKMYQQGGISQDTFLYNLKRGEILPDNHSIEDEKALLEINEGNDFDFTNVTPLKKRFEIERDESGKPLALKETAND